MKNKQIRFNCPGFSKLKKTSAAVLFEQLPYIACLGTAQYMSLQNQGSTAASLKLVLNLYAEKILTFMYEALSGNSFCLDTCEVPCLQHYFYNLSKIHITRYVISYQPYWFPTCLSCNLFMKAFGYKITVFVFNTCDKSQRQTSSLP